MNLEKVLIKNFKSIKEIEFDIKKYGNSFTTMFLGINESGKSNILQAMSYLDAPEEEFDYYEYQNQKDENNSDVEISFYLSFGQKEDYLEEALEDVEGREHIKFEIYEVKKVVYLRHDEVNFKEDYTYKFKNLSKGLFIKALSQTKTVAGRVIPVETIQISKHQTDDTFVELTSDNFSEFFDQKIIRAIRWYEPNVSTWEPSNDYLISTEDLNEFSEKQFSKPALKNIFTLAGYKSKSEIQAAIKSVDNGQRRSKLCSKLEDSLNKYIKNVWKHEIDVVIDITETGKLTLSIKDTGEENRHDRLPINGRSEGARHFLSLILSLSIESTQQQRRNQLILIDEPETHLHPSGIRDLRNELLKIGTKNYLFISTHSPFLIDRKNKDRNIIIKKNKSALTEKILIDEESDVIDDEVLREAFGLEVYKDLLNPHSILVEGASDKKIIQKILKLKTVNQYGITNGHGSNIDTLAAKLNDLDISLLVLVDDDKDGHRYREKIIKVGGSYSEKNVVTLKQLVPGLPEGATIEDVLGKDYIESTFKSTYKDHYESEECDLELTDDGPFIPQLKAYLAKQGIQDSDRFIEIIKDKLATKLALPKTTYKNRFPLLNELADALITKLGK